MHKQAGFTLIELLIAVAIVAILIGIGVPSYQSTIRSNNLDNANKLITSALSYGRTTAMAYNQSLFLTISDNMLTFSTDAASIAATTTNALSVSDDNNASVDFNTPGSHLEFNRNGSLANTNTIRYCQGNAGVDIAVLSNGSTSTTAISCP